MWTKFYFSRTDSESSSLFTFPAVSFLVLHVGCVTFWNYMYCTRTSIIEPRIHFCVEHHSAKSDKAVPCHKRTTFGEKINLLKTLESYPPKTHVHEPGKPVGHPKSTTANVLKQNESLMLKWKSSQRQNNSKE